MVKETVRQTIYALMLFAFIAVMYLGVREFFRWHVTEMRVVAINGNEIIAVDIYDHEWAFYGNGFFENEVIVVTRRDNVILGARER